MSVIATFGTPLPGPVLDLACGLGQNALWLAGLGLSVVGVDASRVAVARAQEEASKRHLKVTFERGEVRAGAPLSRNWRGRWGGIVVVHFLDRGLFPQLEHTLAPGGVLVYKTHLSHPLRSPEFRPHSPEHLLRPGELLSAFPTLVPLAFSEWAQAGRAYSALVARHPAGRFG